MNHASLQPRPADHVDAQRPVTETQAAEHIAATAFHPDEPRRIGAEVEWLVTAAEEDRRLHPERLQSLLFSRSAMPTRTALGFEPGGALGLITGPHISLHECFEALESDRRRVTAALDTIGAGLLGIGLDPVRPPRRLLRSPRYQAMEQLFDQDGRAGRWMMANTASVQIHLDAGTDGSGHRSLQDRWALAHWLTPVLLAVFANSPFLRGKASLWRSTRQHVRSAVDRTRTGPVPIAGPHESWAQYALDARVMAVRGAEHWLVPERLTFREWIRTASPRPATLADLEYHLTTLFPPVRPRSRRLELRMIDSQPGRDWIVPVAVISALFEDPRANDAAWAAVERLWSDGAGPSELYVRASSAALCNTALAEAARACVAAAREALDRNGAGAEIVALVDDFIERHTSRSLTPADILLRMHPGGRWHWRGAAPHDTASPSCPVRPRPPVAFIALVPRPFGSIRGFMRSNQAVPQFRRSGFTLCRLRGIPIVLGYTWLLLAVMVMVVYAPIVRRSVPDIGEGTAYLVAALFAITLLVSVFLHELGHALVSLRAGIGVRQINLDALGGFTEMDRESPRPGTAAAIALAGPAVSALLGVAGLAALAVTEPGSLAWQLAFQVCVANLLVAVYNLLPGLPLDGGKALQAAVWAATGDRWTGYRLAGWAGRAVAVATIGGGLWLFTNRWFSWLGLILLAMVAFELWRGATAAIKAGGMGPKISGLDATALARPVTVVPVGATLGEALAAAEGREVVAVGERPVGVLDRAAADAVPEGKIASMPLTGLLRSAGGVPAVEAGLRGQALVDAIGRSGAEAHFVVEEGRLTGLLYTADVVRALR